MSEQTIARPLLGSNEQIIRRLMQLTEQIERRIITGVPAGYDGEHFRLETGDLLRQQMAYYHEIMRRLDMTPAERDAELMALPVREMTVGERGAW